MQASMQQLQQQQRVRALVQHGAASRQQRCGAPRAGKNGSSRTSGLADPAIPLVDGAPTSGPSLAVTVNGLQLPNPFVIGSGPPGYVRGGWLAVSGCNE
jgi:hypothetical protein